MQTNSRLGCFSFSGIAGAIIMLVFIVGVGIAEGGTLFSPGALNAQATGIYLGGVQSHAEIKGNCNACHAAVWDKDHMIDRCLACHTDLTTNSNGFHAIMKAQGRVTGCTGCHTEHNGPEADITIFDTSNFPHEILQFSLVKHQILPDGTDFLCSDCHGEKISKMDQTRCTACHQSLDLAFTNQHLADFGLNCITCHDGVDRFGKAFDHEQTGYSLVGKHQLAACSSCHVDAADPSTFKIEKQDCYSCHRDDDAHFGTFGDNCATCHSPENWKPASFDHNNSNFPLVGKHLQVECTNCHQNNQYKGTPQKCVACHQKDDTHNGTNGQECGSCHTAENWDAVNFDHSLSNFPLTGKHSSVGCENCHQNNQFKGIGTACSDCHPDPSYHQGLLGIQCETCHSTAGWLPATYNLPHTFPLNHEDVTSCKDCHVSTLKEYTCYTCHNQNKIASKHNEEGIRDFTNCVKCHANGQSEGDD